MRQRIPHDRNEPDRARQKTIDKNESYGYFVRFLSYVLHGGKHSTCPPNISIHNGSNDIVVTALSGQQIITMI